VSQTATPRFQQRSEQFDLLLADLEMPGNEDLALVKGAGRHGNLPIIIVTGFRRSDGDGLDRARSRLTW
jgi:CheY-like chemotaxis protein